MPSFVLIQQRYRHWDSALIDAGLAPNNTRQNRRVVDRAPSGRPYPEDELIRWLRESYAELGEPFTTSAYHNWRIEKIEAESTPIRLVRIPDHPAFYRRFGNWANACARAGLGREHSDPNQTEHGQADAGALPEPRARRDRGETDG